MGKINASPCIKKKLKQKKCGNKRTFYIKLHLKDRFGMEFTAYF